MFSDGLTIRKSTRSDQPVIAEIHRLAFGRDAEAVLAIELIRSKSPTISLVADHDGTLIGHVLLTAIGAPLSAAILAPLAVTSSFREMQVGSTLVRSSLAAAARNGFEAVFVLGDPMYYERFGFTSAFADPFTVEWQGPHFMAVETRNGALKGKKGRLVVPAAFSAV